MAFTDINSEDRLVQKTFAGHLRDKQPPISQQSLIEWLAVNRCKWLF